MYRLRKLSFLLRLSVCMLLAIIINSALGFKLADQLSQKSYSLLAEITYPENGSIELHYDTGEGFNQIQEIKRKANKGRDTIVFPFQLVPDEQLKFLRLDFGSNTSLESVMINSLELKSKGRSLFKISYNDIENNIVFSKHIKTIDEVSSMLILDTSKSSFDPYIVLKPINELIYPLWARTLLLLLPWLILFIYPTVHWIKLQIYEKNLVLIFLAFFMCTIPLKIAWVTFSTILLLAYSLFNYYDKRNIKINSIEISVCVFFLIPTVLLGEGHVSELAIPMGFLLFPLIGTLISFSTHYDNIKRMYVSIFLLLSSIIIVSWLILIFYGGYYYNINLHNYFSSIKTTAHAVLYWLFYDHTTFISFFILIGNVFCTDLLKNKLIPRSLFIVYFAFSFSAILLLGSRFALVLYLVLPILFLFSAKNIARYIFPTIFIGFATMAYFIGYLDGPRLQLWKMSGYAIKEMPWSGHGTGKSEAILQNIELARKAGFNTVLEMNHSHNQYLTYLLENGIIGLLIFFLAFANIIYCFYKLNNKSMLIICSMTLLLMLFESPFRTATPLYVISFLLVIFSQKKGVSLKKNQEQNFYKHI